MSTARRAKSDSVSTAVSAFKRIGLQIGWPAQVSKLPRQEDADRAAAIFGGILEARDPADWRPSNLMLSAQLANTMAQADRITMEIEAEGWTVPSPKNPLQQIRNPLLDALTLISSRQLSLTRALALNGPPSDRKTVSKNARTADAARRSIAGDDLESLLAQPVTQ